MEYAYLSTYLFVFIYTYLNKSRSSSTICRSEQTKKFFWVNFLNSGGFKHPKFEKKRTVFCLHYKIQQIFLWNNSEFLEDLGNKISNINGESLSKSYCFQSIGMAIQRVNVSMDQWENWRNIQNSLRKQGFLTFIFNFDDFSKFVPFLGNISAKTQQFYLWKKNSDF